VDDLKVLASTTVGIGNWWLDIEVYMKCAVSFVTILYIVLKIKVLLSKSK